MTARRTNWFHDLRRVGNYWGRGIVYIAAWVVVRGNALAASVYDIGTGPVHIAADGTYAIFGTTTLNRITVQSGVTADVILLNTAIDLSGQTGSCAFAISSNASVNLILSGSNYLVSGEYCAGLQVPSGAALFIISNCPGSLVAIGGVHGAGIGGGGNSDGGNISIFGGTIFAYGLGDQEIWGLGGAGIGGGGGTEFQKNGKNGGIITIGGHAIVFARGGEGGSGIGGSAGCIGGVGGTIRICGNARVKAIGSGHMDGGGAGIGGGGGICYRSSGGHGGSIWIGEAAVVMATGWEARLDRGSAGIGGGDLADSGTIIIAGGQVTAEAGPGGAGIGGGAQGAGGVIRMEGDTEVDASGKEGGAGIGGGMKGAGGLITINAGRITASGSGYPNDGAAGIGGGAEGNGGSIVIDGGTITAKGGMGFIEEAPGIGNGCNGLGADIVITGGSIKATPGSHAMNWNPTDGQQHGLHLVELDRAIAGDGTAVVDIEVAIEQIEPAYVYRYRGAGHGSEILTDADLYFYLPGGATYEITAGTNVFTVQPNIRPSLQVDGVDVSVGKGPGWGYDGNLLTIMAEGDYVLEGTSDCARVGVASGVTASILMRNLEINVAAIYGAAAFAVASNAAVDMRLEGFNTLESGPKRSGLEIPQGASLNIRPGSGRLEVKGGSFGAGIGGGYFCPGGEIQIQGGDIRAAGGEQAAGLGGGYCGAGGLIRISGGTVTVVGGNPGAAGIGGGDGGHGGQVVISGGSIKANGGSGGVDIGSGLHTPVSGTLTDPHGNAVYRILVPNAGNGAHQTEIDIPVSGGETYRYIGRGHPDDANLYFYLPNGIYSFDAWMDGIGLGSYAVEVTSHATTSTIITSFPPHIVNMVCEDEAVMIYPGATNQMFRLEGADQSSGIWSWTPLHYTVDSSGALRVAATNDHQVFRLGY